MNVSKKYYKPQWDFLTQDKKGVLCIDGYSVSELTKKYGTPVYVFVEKKIRANLRRFKNAFPYENLRPQYACKINSNLELLKIVRDEGFELDASSVGEIILALLAGYEPHQITFTNVYKTEQDITFAAKLGVQAITADSIEEVQRIASVGLKLEMKIRIMLRVNPYIEFGKYTTKKKQFGVPWNTVKDAINDTIKEPYLQLIGFHFHGGYIEDSKVYFEAAKKLLQLADYCKYRNVTITHIDLGGGFPVQYKDEEIFTPEDMGEKFIAYWNKLLKKYDLLPPTLIFEPGKFIAAHSGVGLIKVVSKKRVGKKMLAITDGTTYGFVPDCIVYNCYYEILPATKLNKPRINNYRIAGCTCDSIDIIAESRLLPKLEVDDILSIMDCGAYSNVMASNFNTIKRAPMILIQEDGTIKTIRRRDRYSEMFAPELDILKPEPHKLKSLYNLFRVNINKIWKGKTTNGEQRNEENE